MDILMAKRKLLAMGGLAWDTGGSTTTSSGSNKVQLPDYAAPYVQDMMAKTAALTDTNQNPYRAYEGQRVADFTALQNQAMGAAGTMAPDPNTQAAAAQAGQISQQAMGAGQGFVPGQFNGGTFDSNAAQQYMNPYMQNVVDIQQREAQRQADIQGTQRAAQAVGSGAFGGSRQAIMDAEAARNLATQKGDIQAQGLNQSYMQAANQFNQDMGRSMQAQQLGEQSRQYGAGLGLQGLQTALQGAQAQGNLGQTGFGQNMAINQLQNQYGTIQQQQAQNNLNNAYGDWQTQQQYPYQQLSFASNMLRGLPMQQSLSTQTQQNPGGSMLGQVAGLGMMAKGFGLFKEGGAVKQKPAGLAEMLAHMRGKA